MSRTWSGWRATLPQHCRTPARRYQTTCDGLFNVEYAVGYADYPEPLEGTERITAFMDRVRDGGALGIRGTLLEWKDSQFEGHPGRVYIVEFGGGYVMNSKIVVVKNRLYLIAATTYGQKAPADVARIYETAAAKFLNSFKLTSGNTTGRQWL